MIFYDTETCGLFGLAVTIQWAEDDGPITIHEVWREPIRATIELIEYMMEREVCGFNLAFDHFHLSKLYTTFIQFPDWDELPEDHVEELAILEEKGRWLDYCLKPKAACDLLLHARKGPYQSTMDRSEIRIRRVPAALAYELAAELDSRITVSDIYFARKKANRSKKWRVEEIIDNEGEKEDDFRDVVLRFAPTRQLKALAADALKIPIDTILRFADIEISKVWLPEELGYAPFALAVGKPGRWNRAWPEVIRHHISHWAFFDLARKYAIKDVDYLRRLFDLFAPPIGDDDSELACMVAAARWRGFAIDLDGIRLLKSKAIQAMGKTPQAPGPARFYVQDVMADAEKLVMGRSTKKVLLEEIATWENPCECKGKDGECPLCKGAGTTPHPAAVRAQEVLDARQSKKEIELYDKLLQAGRFHASFNVIGTLSSRMSGADKLNPQGIKREKAVRSQFPLADRGNILCGGDFDSFEVVLAEANYDDPELRKALLSGRKIHAIFGTFCYPGMTYEDVLANKERYTRSKSAVFAMLYGGEGHTLKTRLGVPIEVAEQAYNEFCRQFPGVGICRKRVFDMFAALRQPNGIGTAVEWHNPADYIESMFGFRRYFTLENAIMSALFSLAQSPPQAWRKIPLRYTRHDREQTAMGAVQSALYGCAFAIQGSNQRAANNHLIQSSGAQITKAVQRKIWDIQPSGIHTWAVQPMNIHDELMCVTHPDYTGEVEAVVNATVESFRPKVPLIKMEWATGLSSWADK